MENNVLQKFSLRTSKEGTRAYLRVLMVCPTSERIIEDWDGVIASMWRIKRANGVSVPDSNGQQIRRGHCADAARIGIVQEPKSAGGYQPRKQAENDYGHEKLYHKDAQFGLQVKVENSRSRFLLQD